jgi:hypothetical protein
MLQVLCQYRLHSALHSITDTDKQFASFAPKILKPHRRQLRVAHRVLDVLVPEVRLQRPGVVSLIGQRIAASVPQHVGVALEAELGRFPSPNNHLGEASGGKRRPTLGREHKRRTC